MGGGAIVLEGDVERHDEEHGDSKDDDSHDASHHDDPYDVQATYRLCHLPDDVGAYTGAVDGELVLLPSPVLTDRRVEQQQVGISSLLPRYVIET